MGYQEGMRQRPSRTAEAVCLMRALDRRRPAGQRIIDDPYAQHFLGPAGQLLASTVQVTERLAGRPGGLEPALITYVLCRHRFIDDALSRFLADPSPAQVVVLGAGYDSRAWRFAEALAGRPIFEVDHPATAARKAELVGDTGWPGAEDAGDGDADGGDPVASDRRVVVTDFQSQGLAEVLEAGGLDRRVRTFFAWEGVSMYLTRQAVKDTLSTIRALGGPGAEVAMDFWYLLDSPDLLATARRISGGLLHLFGEPITFGIHPEDAVHFLERLGFDALDTATSATLSARYVRDDRQVYPAVFAVHARGREAT